MNILFFEKVKYDGCKKSVTYLVRNTILLMSSKVRLNSRWKSIIVLDNHGGIVTSFSLTNLGILKNKFSRQKKRKMGFKSLSAKQEVSMSCSNIITQLENSNQIIDDAYHNLIVEQRNDEVQSENKLSEKEIKQLSLSDNDTSYHFMTEDEYDFDQNIDYVY
ncbi:hypothetical protein TRFO_17394 [Tritrichomonas foetus]|uniref:Uncharacterized protein n=1 Tax=Tritrichomonas foetus TaxID=1144522 RepID=A0A1J4KSP7_9EUKA|nr:hypothetical protein TRFO_17394 [Tritrichomonas foetus]|eukprot:OHT12686.1 hypothetical protein TRFO_17394 [Tritrichomonas foetus]